MRQLMTKTLDAIFTHTHHPLLPSMSVHTALKQFIDVCYRWGDHRRRGYRTALLSLIHTLCRKMKEDPSIVGIFFDVFPEKEKRVGGEEKQSVAVREAWCACLHAAHFLSPSSPFCSSLPLSFTLPSFLSYRFLSAFLHSSSCPFFFRLYSASRVSARYLSVCYAVLLFRH